MVSTTPQQLLKQQQSLERKKASSSTQLYVQFFIIALFVTLKSVYNESKTLVVNMVQEDEDRGDLHIQHNNTFIENNTRATTKQQVSSSSADCGMYYYYHVGKTGGTSVLKWQKDMARISQGDIAFRGWYYFKEYQTGIWNEGLNDMVLPMVNNIAANKHGKNYRWLSIHQHHRTPGLRTMIPLLREWRRQLHSKGCKLVATVTLREPMPWIESLLTYNNISDSDIVQYLGMKHERQSKYLLYNFFQKYPGTELPINQSMEEPAPLTDEEIEEIIGYLQHDFDIVGQTHNMTSFIQESMELTGWDKYLKATKAHTKTNTSNNFHFNKSQKRNFSTSLRAPMEESVLQDLVLWDRIFGNNHSTS